MATLSGNKIKDTYQSLVKFSDNGNITVGAKQLTDGFGNNSPMFVSTTQVGIGVTPEAGLNLHVFGDAKIGSNLTVIGNLVVEGSTTTVGTDTLTVKDPLIVLANNNTSTDAVDIGFYGKYTPSGTTLYSGLFREALTGKYRLFKGLEDEPTTTVNTSGTGYTKADLVIGDLNAIDIEASGNISTPFGTISGDIVGGSISGSTGDFSGNVDIDGQLDVDDVINIQGSAFGRIEIGGNSGGYIDLKAPNSDDYDFRIITSSGGNEITTATGDLIFNTAETLALTIDTSQDATFVGGVTANSFSGNLTGNVTGNLTGNVTGDVTGNVTGDLTGDVTGDVTGNVTGDLTGNVTATSVLADGVTATTQSDGDNSTKVATTAYVDTAIEGHDTLAEVLAGGNTSGGTSMIISNGDDLTVNTSTLKVDSTNSQIGINNASPSGFTGQYSKDLIIGDGTGDRGITIYSSSSAYGSLFFKDAEGSSTGNGGFIAYNHFVDGMEFGIGNAGLGAGSLSIGSSSIFMRKKLIVDATYSTTNTLTVDPSNARVGIFNDSPSYRLDVAGDARFTGQTIISGDLAVDTDTLFVDVSEDSVGINTANPSAFGRNELVVTVPDNGGITIASATDEYGMIEFSDGSDTGQQNFIGCDHDGDIMGFNAWGYHLFSLGEGVPKMTINTAGVTVEDDFKAGDLGDPYLLLADVSTATVYVAGTVNLSNNLLIGDDGFIGENVTVSNSLHIGCDTNDSLRFGHLIPVEGGYSSDLVIDSSGNVSVTNSADAILKVETSSGTSSSRLFLKSPTREWRIGVNDSFNSGSLFVYNTEANTYPFLIDTSGNVSVLKTDSSTYSSITPVADLILSRKNTDNTNNETVGIRFDVTGWSGSTTGGAAIEAIQPSNASSADLAFLTRNAGTWGERMRIDSSGNVGIGTDSPSTKLEIFGNNSARNTIQNLLTLNGGTSSNNVYSGFGMGIKFNGRDYSNEPRDYAYINSVMEASGSSTPGGDPGFSSQLQFWTNSGGATNTLPTERMRITSGGAIEIRNGSTVGGEIKLTGADNDLTINGARGQIKLQINGTNAYEVDSVQLYPSADNSKNLGTSFLRWSTVYAANGINTSDETLKENIEECDLGIDFIDSLKPKTYNFKDLKEDNDAYGKQRYGLIAQDLLQTELKDSVFGKKDGEYGLSYNDLIAPMIKAIQELKAEIDELKTQINN